MGAFDDRIVQVGIEINGELLLYEGLDIRATGEKFFSSTNNKCSIRISNLSRDHRNYILTKATPLATLNKNRMPINVTLDIGRKSYGTFRLFEGSAFALGATQPPDIGITLEVLTNNIDMAVVDSVSFSAVTPLKVIAQKVADMNNLILNYQVKVDKSISNYSYTGPVGKQVQKLSEMGGIFAHVDGGILTVKDNAPDTTSDDLIRIDENSGMVGVPQPNMYGVVVKVLANSFININTRVEIKSSVNPSVNGIYTVWNIQFDISNRDQPFWYNLFCLNDTYIRGTVAG